MKKTDKIVLSKEKFIALIKEENISWLSEIYMPKEQAKKFLLGLGLTEEEIKRCWK